MRTVHVDTVIMPTNSLYPTIPSKALLALTKRITSRTIYKDTNALVFSMFFNTSVGTSLLAFYVISRTLHTFLRTKHKPSIPFIIHMTL